MPRFREIQKMAEVALAMLRRALDAFARLDVAGALDDDAVARSERIPGSTLSQDRRDERHELAAEFENEGAVSVQFGQRRVVGNQGTQRASVVGLDDTGSAPVA